MIYLIIQCFFGLNIDYSNLKAYELLREKVDAHKLTIEKLLKMRKDDRLDEGMIKRYRNFTNDFLVRKSTRNKEKNIGEGKNNQNLYYEFYLVCIVNLKLDDY